jgi:hypothetical protein
MRIIIAIFWLLLIITGAQAQSVGSAGPGRADPCSYQPKSSAAINITSATTTQLVAVSGSTAVYVCGFAVTIPNTATTATSVLFEYGTSTNCTGTHALTGTFGSNDAVAVSANPTVVTYGDGSSTVFAGAASNGLCAVTTGNGTLAIEGVMTYVQQ